MVGSIFGWMISGRVNSIVNGVILLDNAIFILNVSQTVNSASLLNAFRKSACKKTSAR